MDFNDEAGLNDASGSTTDTIAIEAAWRANNNEVLEAIASLHSELTLVKSEICQKIEAEISEVTTTLRGETAALKAENDTAISALKAQMDSQNQTLKELADSASSTSDMLQDLEDKVKKLSGQVETPSEKCLDLEGRSKRQNLRVVGIR